MTSTPSPAPIPASQASQGSAANGEALPGFPGRWPTRPDKPQPYDVRLSMIYHVALAAAWEARARLMSELLGHFESVLDREDDRRQCSAMLLRIGPLPELPSPKEQRT